MIHGKGQQFWMTKKYEEKRNKALTDRSDYDSDDLDDWDVSFPDGGGRHDPDTYLIWTPPYPLDASIRNRQRYDIRDKPEIGF